MRIFCYNGLGRSSSEKINPKGSDTMDNLNNTENRTYRNPFKMPEVPNTGDPFVMRYDGRYYLYQSAGGPPSYLHCWRSDDLVDWSYMGISCKLPEIVGGYAPEVIYNKGKFYMCTSPHGNGHFLLMASKPEGPYKPVTDRIGQRIDGSFFIDDDGTTYFYRAEGSGINYHRMSDPKTVELPGSPISESRLNGWTEGPMVLRHGGKYFLTYTGNHLCSKGYKVAYSVSDTSPVSGYANMKNRAFLIEGDDEFHGLGHSSSALSPDMDGASIIYHSFELVKEPRHRSMNVDRLFFNGSRMYSNTIWWDQAKPTMPDYSVRGKDEFSQNGNLLLTKKATPAVYTAELNVDAGNNEFTMVYANGKGKFAVVGRELSVVENDVVIVKKSLPTNVVMASNNSYRFSRTKDGGMLLCLNNNQEFLSWKSSLKGGKIGFADLPESAKVGFVGFSSFAGGNSDKSAVKGVPGRMDAVHSREDHKKTKYFENGRDIYCVDASVGMTFTFPINVKANGDYSVVAQVRNADAGVFLTVNGRDLSHAAPTSYDHDGSAKLLLGKVSLSSDDSELTVTAGCELTLDSIELIASEDACDIEFVTDGKLCESAEILGEKGVHSFVKKNVGLSCGENNAIAYGGGHGWADYTVDAHVVGYMGSTGTSEILFRMQKESWFPAQPACGGYGYSIRVGCGNISLVEWNYGERMLVSYAVDDVGRFEHDVSVSVKGSVISVSLDGRHVFDYDVPMGNPTGKFGVRVTGECFGITSTRVKKI